MDWIEQIKRGVEQELLWKEKHRLSSGPPWSPIEYSLMGKPLLRMTQTEAVRMLMAEHSDGVRGQLRTRDAVLDFVQKHGIQHELVDDPDRNARVESEAHKRMKAAALTRRRHVAYSGMARRAYL